MYKNIKPSILALCVSLISMNAYAKDSVAVEWAPFIKVEGVSDNQLIKAADVVNSIFLENQKGFIKRELVKKNDTEYADIIHWKTKNNAIDAGEKVMSCVQCAEYFKLMDMEASAKAGAGFSHYDVIKVWK